MLRYRLGRKEFRLVSVDVEPPSLVPPYDVTNANEYWRLVAAYPTEKPDPVRDEIPSFRRVTPVGITVVIAIPFRRER